MLIVSFNTGINKHKNSRRLIYKSTGENYISSDYKKIISGAGGGTV
jgi:hypothetical protein